MIARLRSALVLACLACPAGLAQAQTGADSCAAAPLVGAGVYTGTTVGATFDGPGVCGASESTPDVWFKVSPPTNRQLIVETCSGTPYDSVLSIHASCGGAVLACNDDTCNLQSRVTVQAVGGQTYWVRVSGFAGDTGSYTLTISLPEPPPPSADDCANAVLITPGSYNGTTLGSTHDGTSDCGASGESPDVWYKIVPPTDRQLVVETCGGITNYDSVLAIHSDCGAGPILACNDDSCGLQSRVQAPVSAGITYYIRVAGFAGSAGDFTISVSFTDPPPPPTNGPDVTVVDVLDVGYYASIGGINSYAVGTNSCNVGDAPVAWYAGNPFHPVISQNMYRLKGGRFEQIGMSWLKHGFASTNSPGCGNCIQPPDGGAQLGISCTDAYGSGLNGSQSLLGPRSEVNAATGEFTYPFGGGAITNELDRRLQVRRDDVDPAQNPGALYFVDTHYVTQDDAQWNNGLNNLSYRRLATPAATGAPGLTGPTLWQVPGIRAWADTDPTVTITNLDYVEPHVVNGNPIDIDCRFILGAKVTDNANGTWTYEYALQNINSHRSGGSFSIPVAAGVAVTGIGFHDTFYHSGEPYDNTDWSATRTADALVWSSPQTHAQNPNSNALRWSTLYNFRFTADQPPSDGPATIGLFRPGTPAAISGTTRVPTGGAAPCDPDVNQDGNADQDDVAYLINVIGGGPNPTGIDPDFNRDGNADQDDVAALVNTVGGGGCP